MDVRFPHRGSSRSTVRSDSQHAVPRPADAQRADREPNDDLEAQQVSEAIQYYFGADT